MHSLHVLDVNPLSDESFTNIFSHTVGCLFAVQKLCNLIQSHLFIFTFVSLAQGDMFTKKSLMFMFKIFLPMFFLRVLCFHDLYSGLW